MNALPRETGRCRYVLGTSAIRVFCHKPLNDLIWDVTKAWLVFTAHVSPLLEHNMMWNALFYEERPTIHRALLLQPLDKTFQSRDRETKCPSLKEAEQEL